MLYTSFLVSRHTNDVQECALVTYATPDELSAAIAANPIKVGTEEVIISKRLPGQVI